MKHLLYPRTAAIAAGLLGLTTVLPAPASLIANGGFEAGFTSWTRVDQLGSEGTFELQSGTSSPLTLETTPAPPGGNQAAMTDAEGPGSHLLYQDFVVGALGAVLRFDLFIGNRATQFATPPSSSLAFDLTSQVGAETLNQQARVDLMTVGADPFSTAAGDVVLNLVQSAVGDPLVSGYTPYVFDLSALFAANAGQTLRLRFAETDNLQGFQLGVDNVSLDELPAPGTLSLFGAAVAALGVRRRHRVVRARGGPASRGRETPGPGLWQRSSHAIRAAWNWPRRMPRRLTACLLIAAGLSLGPLGPVQADSDPPTLLDPNLVVTTVVNTGLSQPIGIVFLDADDFLVLEKATGQVKRVISGAVQAAPVLDLPVNAASERGLLSLVLSPGFPNDPSVYIRWTESSTGADSTVTTEVPPLGNRVDRFVWNGTSLVFADNLIRLRALQTDNIAVTGHAGTNNVAPAANHNGGVMKFGPDGKLYLFMGDQGRRGWMQNLANGPFITTPLVDDTLGGPAPDQAHLSGVILRLNTDGTAPSDNPFFAIGTSIGGEVGANLQKVYSYGHRNGFGMAFDPASGALWETENADDAYSEINRVVPGMNGGWIQLAGPSSRYADWKLIETTQFSNALQQVRYPPTRAAYRFTLAQARMVMLPGATYVDPDFSWRYEIGPSGAAFVVGDALGANYNGTLWIGSARSFQQVGANGGSLYCFKMTADRLRLDVSADPRLADRVADNLFRTQKFEGTESETLKIGSNFGTTTDIEQDPDGNLYVVSLTDNAIYRISRAGN
ncbi:PQQ-dependent sugar dehydrogenase [uncultured Thiodictyon sp.]|uniref:PQQ-dependent sugar dehydrogenase n=1 Tax=uncultured Thiodictyon sp. TaxID=1846217 RepID=UPI0025E99457|nr:PQQ-dependent sugar dehydrogenase [uncultured Thiodictyon sp.]